MYCPKCGALVGDTDSFCAGCGARLSGTTTYAATNPYKAPRGTRPVSDVRLVSFLLGLILGIFGLVIALIIYSGNMDFEESPTGTVVIWCIFGMFFWVFVIFFLLLAMIGVSAV